jgi:hypothetical protein
MNKPFTEDGDCSAGLPYRFRRGVLAATQLHDAPTSQSMRMRFPGTWVVLSRHTLEITGISRLSGLER